MRDAEAWHVSFPVRIHAGRGLADRVDDWTPAGKTLLITSAGFTARGVTDRMVNVLKARGDVVVFDKVTPNPQLDAVDEATNNLRAEHPLSLIALGGGSVLDTAKVLSLTLAGSIDRPLHRVFRNGMTIRWTAALPVVAIPTTAGTGAEVTPFATLWDATTFRKHSLADPLMLPGDAVLDPALTLSLSRDETLYGGLDTMSHALESLWNRNRNPVTETLSLRALELTLDALELLLDDCADIRRREQMQHASLLAGMAISQTRTAIAHAISYPLTSRYGVPHGLACGFTLSSIIDVVSSHEACTSFKPQLLRAKATLDRLGLGGALAARIGRQQVYDVIDEMTAPGRSENFVIDFTRDDIERVVSKSGGWPS